MAGQQDILAGKAFVELWVKDYAFRRRLAEDQQLFREAFDEQAGEALGSSAEGYDQMASTADGAMELIYTNTMELVDATEQLNAALESVMESYLGLADMQQEGITLSAGGGQGAIEGPGGEPQGGDSAVKGIVRGFGTALGEHLTARFIESDFVQGKLVDPLISRIGSVTEKAAATKRIGERAAAKTEAKVGTSPFASVGAGTPIMAELVESGSSAAPIMAELVESGSQAAPIMAQFADATKNTGVVMAELVPQATAATASINSVGAASTAATASFWPLAIAVAAAVPLLAAVDETTGGTLTNSGMYPAWLKKIGDAINGFGPVGAIMRTLAEVIKLNFTYAKMLWSVLEPIVSVVFIPLKVILGAVVIALKTFGIALKMVHAIMWPFVAVINAALHPIQTLKTALTLVIWPLKQIWSIMTLLPGVMSKVGSAALSVANGIISVAKSIASAAIASAKFAVSTVWSGAVGTFNAVKGAINGIGSALQSAGKWTAFLGGGLTALGALVVGPLTKAAQIFQEQGEKIDKLAKGYKMAAETASVYSYIAGQMNKAVGERGGQSGGGARMMEGRIAKIKDTVKEGTPEFEKWRKQAEASGMVMGGAAVESALALDDAFDRLRDSLQGLWVTMGQAVAPIIVDLTETMVGAVRGIITYVKQNQALIATAFRVAKAVATVGTVVAALGTALFTIGSLISPLTVALTALAGGMAIVEYRTGVGRGLWDAYKGSVIDIYNTIVRYLGPIVAFVSRIMAGVKDAIKGGDLALAARIAWGGLRIAWIEGLMWLSERTSGTFSGILANLAAGQWKAAADGAMSMIHVAWLRMKLLVIGVWHDVQRKTAEVWTDIVNRVDEGFTDIQNKAAPVWAMIVKGAEGVWESVKTSFSAAMEMFGTFAEAMKVFGQEFVNWVVKPFLLLNPATVGAAAFMAEYLENTMKDVSGAFTSTAATIEARWKSKKSAMLTPEDQERLNREESARNVESAGRIAGRKQELAKKQHDLDMSMGKERSQIEHDIIGLEATGQGGPGGVVSMDEYNAAIGKLSEEKHRLAYADELMAKRQEQLKGATGEEARIAAIANVTAAAEKQADAYARALDAANKLKELESRPGAAATKTAFETREALKGALAEADRIKNELAQPKGVELPGKTEGGAKNVGTFSSWGITGMVAGEGTIGQKQLTVTQEIRRIMNELHLSFQVAKKWYEMNPKIPEPQVFGP